MSQINRIIGTAMEGTSVKHIYISHQYGFLLALP
uniref:Uncharacterized protein n=1 Tax=Anguilla anguilla TaxID=7936 RepID=A0A0E9RQ03_ANGAN